MEDDELIYLTRHVTQEEFEKYMEEREEMNRHDTAYLRAERDIEDEVTTIDELSELLDEMYAESKAKKGINQVDDSKGFVPEGSISFPVYEDKQVGGSHYNMPIQPIDYIVENDLGYREGNVVKYVSRHEKKNGAEDIKKAIHYLEMILEDYES